MMLVADDSMRLFIYSHNYSAPFGRANVLCAPASGPAIATAVQLTSMRSTDVIETVAAAHMLGKCACLHCVAGISRMRAQTPTRTFEHGHAASRELYLHLRAFGLFSERQSHHTHTHYASARTPTSIQHRIYTEWFGTRFVVVWFFERVKFRGTSDRETIPHKYAASVTFAEFWVVWVGFHHAVAMEYSVWCVPPALALDCC